MLYIETHRAGLAFLLVLAVSLIAAIFDVRTRRIPNALVLLLFLGGLSLNAFSGVRFAAADLVIVAAVLVLGTVAFTCKLIGGGDIKLLAAAAGALAYPAALTFVLFTFISGGVVAVMISLSQGRLRATFENVRGIALPMFAGVAPARIEGGTSMPYALAICSGAVLTFLTNGFVPNLRF